MVGIEELALTDRAGPPVGDATRSRQRMLHEHDVRTVGSRRSIDGDALPRVGDAHAAIQRHVADSHRLLAHHALTAGIASPRIASSQTRKWGRSGANGSRAKNGSTAIAGSSDRSRPRTAEP